MKQEDTENLQEARNLMKDFAARTGLFENEGDPEQRYLWTDAFAVQTYFGLARATGSGTYKDLAIKLIDLVHEKLGRYHPDDPREGWISGLSEEEGRKHPTSGGLRIGKKLPEREAGEPFNERLEWERDGQYFHYITRWIQALLQAKQETGEQKYALWAAELLLAAEKFIDRSGGRIKMFWKMSIDLSRPLVPSMGAHDPLEGLVCAMSIMEMAPEKEKELEALFEDFKKLCARTDWSTSDPLGIGGLLLNALRVKGLYSTRREIPVEVRAERLLEDSLTGLRLYLRMQERKRPASQRLAFRECGLSLGVNALSGLKEPSKPGSLDLRELNDFIPLAEEIEEFWENPANQRASTWTEHLDINAVTLAASLVAHDSPLVFGAIENE